MHKACWTIQSKALINARKSQDRIRIISANSQTIYGKNTFGYKLGAKGRLFYEQGKHLSGLLSLYVHYEEQFRKESLIITTLVCWNKDGFIWWCREAYQTMSNTTATQVGISSCQYSCSGSCQQTPSQTVGLEATNTAGFLLVQKEKEK